jgi:hypothetical protein
MSFALSRAYGTNSALLTTTCCPAATPRYYSSSPQKHRLQIPSFLQALQFHPQHRSEVAQSPIEGRRQAK